MSRLHVVGAGGHGRVVFDVVRSMSPDRQIVWHDHAWERLKPVRPIEEVLPVVELLDAPDRRSAFVAFGDGPARVKLIEQLLDKGHEVVSLVHAAAIVSPYSSLGVGSVCMAQAVVQTGCTLGIGVIVNTAASIDHDCVIADGVHVAPGAHLAGDVTVGARSWIGIGAVIREGIGVGSDCVVGAGAVVIDHVPGGATVVGNPARPISRTGSPS